MQSSRTLALRIDTARDGRAPGTARPTLAVFTARNGSSSGPNNSDRHEPEVCPAPFTSGDALPPVPLVARSGGGLRARASDQGFLPIDTQKYIMLLDWTGREIRENKCGAIPDNLAPILDRLGLDRSNWVEHGARIRPHVQASGRSREFAGAGGAALLATVVSGKAAAQAAFVRSCSLVLLSPGRSGRGRTRLT